MVKLQVLNSEPLPTANDSELLHAAQQQPVTPPLTDLCTFLCFVIFGPLEGAVGGGL